MVWGWTAGRRAAIVSPTPGTTRDIIDVPLNIAGFSLVVSDTAGLRETADPVEAEGISLARERIAGADLRLAVVDARTLGDAPVDAHAHALRPLVPASDTVVVLTHADLVDPELLRRCEDAGPPATLPGGGPSLCGS